MESKGLGDTIEKITTATGIKDLVRPMLKARGKKVLHFVIGLKKKTGLISKRVDLVVSQLKRKRKSNGCR